MPSYRLHYFPESGNSYKLALMLTLCGEKFEPIWTDFAGAVTRTAEWRRTVNEMGEIPVLEEDGEIRAVTLAVLGQSQADRLHGDVPVPSDVHAISRSACADLLRRRLDDFLSILERHLERNAFAIGERPSIADISMMAYLHYPTDETSYDFATSHPAISSWLGRIAKLPGWQSAYDLLPSKRLTHYARESGPPSG